MGASAPLVSVVCCARNAERFLPQLRQHLDAALRPRCELLLVDHGSSDGTGPTFEQWAAEVPQGRVLHLPASIGLGAVQAAALQAAIGEWVWLIDCDDRPPADAIDRLLHAAVRDDADVVVGRAHLVDAEGSVLRTLDARPGAAVLGRAEAVEQLLAGGIEGYTWTKLFRRSLFDEAAHHDDLAPPLITAQGDFCRVATAIARSSTVTLIDDVVYRYVRHGGSTMDRRDPPLANLAVARDHLVRVARAVLPDTERRRAQIGHFTTWFVAASAVQIPFYVRAGGAVRRSGRRIAARAARAVRPLDVVRIDRTLAIEAVLLKLSPRLYELVFAATHTPTAD